MAKVVENDFLEEQEDTQKGRFLTFPLGEESYGIEIKYVTEIIGIQPITQVPELPDYVRGIINLRGKIIPVMDARLRFRKNFHEYNDRTCVIIIDVQDICIGLIVDSVSEVVTIADENIVPTPSIQKINNRYIRAIGKIGNDMKLLLDCDRLLNEEELSELANLE